MFVKEILRTSERLGGDYIQSDTYCFVMNERKYFLKVHNNRFKNSEGSILQDCHHDGVVRVFEVGMLEDKEYIIMEFLEGEWLHNRKSLLGHHVQQLLAVQEYLKSKGIKHHEIKPEHIMITKEDRVVLIDFGVAESPEWPLLTVLGSEVNKKYSVVDDDAFGMIIKEFSK